MVTLGEVVMILDLHRQGLTLSAIARRTGLDRKTVRKYIERGLEAPVYTPRPPKEPVIAPWRDYLRQRVCSAALDLRRFGAAIATAFHPEDRLAASANTHLVRPLWRMALST